MATQLTLQKLLLEDMRELNIEVATEAIEAKLASLRLQPVLIDQIKEAQLEDPEREGYLK